MLAAIFATEVAKHVAERYLALGGTLLARAIPLRGEWGITTLSLDAAIMLTTLGAGWRCSQARDERGGEEGKEGSAKHETGFTADTVNPV
jgi:hypothetical protein